MALSKKNQKMNDCMELEYKIWSLRGRSIQQLPTTSHTCIHVNHEHDTYNDKLSSGLPRSQPLSVNTRL